jgi:OOP family OmpA-OmpF porin
MKTSHHILMLAMAGAGLLLATQVHGVQPYWHDSSNNVVRDSFGGCVQTSRWRPELATPDCGAAEPTAKDEPVVAATQPAPVVAPAPAPVPVAQPDPITLSGDTSFALGSDALSPAARAELDKLATRINTLANVERIEVAGHTDSLGAAAMNQVLSERRASAVKSYLVEKGVSAEKITTKGYGVTQPVADNATAQGRAMNRRVEIIIHGTR